MDENNFNQAPQQPNFNQAPQQPNFNQPQQPNFNQAPQQPNFNQPPVYNNPTPPAPGKGLSIASMVLGIVSIVLCCIYGGVLGIPGLILGIIGMKNNPQSKGMAIAGIITSIIGIVILIALIIMIVVIGSASISDWEYYLNGYYASTLLK
jgi:hypothetical protein